MQTKPFSSAEEAVLLSVMVTAEQLKAKAAELFKAKDLTHPQYNVLRILRGAGKDGRSCKEIGERMINRDSDITRMLDRLEKQGLITRERQTDDRRVVMAYISKKGLEVLAELDEPVNESNRELLGHMSQKELETLGRLLKKARNA
ncbi:MAG: MarR family transcriptional regulator [Pyrinomonadaceae bacterium]|nr:MarR family transcriptional regulator [Pyrinomonadaceae bacterium]